MPGSGKKLKLVGTRGKALLDLQALVVGHGGVLDTVKKAVTTGPLMTAEGKIDVEAQKAVDAANVGKIKVKVEATIDQFYRLCYDVTGQPPAATFEKNIAKLVAKYPAIVFEPTKVKAAPAA